MGSAFSSGISAVARDVLAVRAGVGWGVAGKALGGGAWIGHGGVLQGQRTLNPLCHKNLHQGHIAPANDFALFFDAAR